MNGLETLLLRHRLAVAGFAPSVFRYPSMRAELPAITASLAEHLHSLGAPVHLVGHSLGGLVILETFATHEDLPPGRIVLLGSPVQGSRAARVIASWSLGPQLLGTLAATELTREHNRCWTLPREIGLIAGSRSAGMGRVFATLPEPNDGTVCVDETRLAGATAQIVLDVSHTGMLMSSAVAASVAQFFTSGAF
jgi:pimeloyl-ACP methyl ester carboxylesterase